MRVIPFSPPDITDEEIAEVTKVLKSGWITTGPETKKFEEEAIRLQDNKISFAYVNRKLHRLGTIFDYEKLKEKYPDIEFAPAYEDDNDEMIENGHK